VPRLERLLRVAAARSRAEDYTGLRVRVLKTLRSALAARCAEDRISVPAVVEALLRGFVDRNPGALAMVDQWVRDEGLEPEPPRGPSLNQNELADVYAAIARGSTTEDSDV